LAIMKGTQDIFNVQTCKQISVIKSGREIAAQKEIKSLLVT